jgi:hypothetical protein
VQTIGQQPQRTPDGAPVHHERHRPEQTTLHRLVQQHASTFIAQAEATLYAALCGQRLLQCAGDWVSHECACYGVTVAAGAAGDSPAQHDAGPRGWPCSTATTRRTRRR